MRVCASVLLSLVVLWAGPSWADKGPLIHWLEDPDNLHALRKAWGDTGYPLEAAYSAAMSSDWNKVTNISKDCLLDIAYVLSNDNLIYMLDASAKIPSGILVGSLTHFGHWDECVDIRDQLRQQDNTKSFHGQMCLINIGATTGHAMNPMQELARTSFGSIPSGLYLKLGTCVPSSCSHIDVQELFTLLLLPLSYVGNIPLAVTVPELECTTRDGPPMDSSDWTCVGILSFMGFLLVISTCYDLITPPERKRNLFIAFSVTTNGRKLLAAPSKGGDSTLSSLHGIRVISIFWIVLCHQYEAALYFTAIMNPLWFEHVLKNLSRLYVTNGFLSVDTFFLMSGLLVGYLYFKQPPASRRLNLPIYYLHRYIRLTPALAFIVLIFATFMYRVSWGPTMQANGLSLRDDCRDNWWSTLLYVENFVHPLNMCADHSWYLMVDMQLYWLAPIILILTTKYPRVGVIAMGILACGGIISVFCVSYLNDIPGNMLAPASPHQVKIFVVHMYNATYSRFVPYIEGMALGYILGNKKLNQNEIKSLSFYKAFFAWLFVAALMLASLLLAYLFYQEPYPSSVAAAFYNSLSRPAWSLGVAGVVYLCAIGSGGPVNTFLSWRGFQMMARFCYSIYLIHVPILYIKVLSIKTYTYVSDFYFLSDFASTLLISFVCAGVMSIVFESPFLVLEKEILTLLREKPRNTSIPRLSNTNVENINDTSKGLDDKKQVV